VSSTHHEACYAVFSTPITSPPLGSNSFLCILV
jgi:hypothetical protein